MSKPKIWAHKGTFLLAAVGSAVGLGNLWRFPYLAGENGGGAFILIYALTIAAVGIPILIAEILLGRASRKSPIMGMKELISNNNNHSAWNVIGWMGALAAFIILSFYSVIAGWAIHYAGLMFSGSLSGASAEDIGLGFDALLASPSLLTLYHSLFLGVSVLIVGMGVHKGIENGLRFMMPALFIILLIVFVYAAIEGDLAASLSFLFTFNLNDLSLEGWLEAMGQSFFTLSLGMGAIMAYGAYMTSDASLTRTAISIAIVDTHVALVAGVAIFALVFGQGLEAGQGPGLMFVTLPLAFADLPGGSLLGGVFFILVIGAALTSAISLVEPVAGYFIERFNISRHKAVALMGLGCWLLGLLTVFSFNIWASESLTHDLFGKSPFDTLEFMTNIMMPLGGVLIALFVGWTLNKNIVIQQISTNSIWRSCWLILLRYVAPTAVTFVFLRTLMTDEQGYDLPAIGALLMIVSVAIIQKLKRNNKTGSI